MRIGLLWHTLRHPNLGCDALSRANIAIISAAARKADVQVEFVTLGQNFLPGRDSEFHDVEIGSPPSPKELLDGRGRFWRDVGSCDVIFDIGEGDSFTDIYGARRFIRQIISKTVVLLRGVPLVLSPQTIGPFDRRWTRFAAAWVMRACRAVFARDHLSTEFLHQLGLKSNIDEFIDVAFRLPYSKVHRAAGDRIRVGVNVSGLLYNGGYTGSNELGLTLDYAALTGRLVTYFAGREDVDLVFVPHVMDISYESPPATGADPRADQPGAAEDDRTVALQLAARVPGATVAPQFSTSSEAKGFISGLDFLVAGRMHACIGALSSGVAVVPIAYSRKFIGLFGGLGYNWWVDAKNSTTEEAEQKVLEAFSKIDQLKAQAAASTTEALSRLDRYELIVGRILTDLRRDGG